MSKMQKILFIYSDIETNEEIIESVWAEQIEAGFKIDNIPFYAKSVALGDVFTIKEIEGEMYADELVEESGNSTVRILFTENGDVAKTRKILVDQFDCESELSNLDNLIAVNIPKEIDYQKVWRYLEEGESLGIWEYEEGCISSWHKSDYS